MIKLISRILFYLKSFRYPRGQVVKRGSDELILKENYPYSSRRKRAVYRKDYTDIISNLLSWFNIK